MISPEKHYQKLQESARSVKSLFTISNYLEVLTSLSGLLFLIGPLTCVILEEIFPWNLGANGEEVGLAGYLLIGSICSFMLAGFSKYIIDRIQAAKLKKQISENELAFCYLSESIDALEKFAITGKEHHLKPCLSGYLHYLQHSETICEIRTILEDVFCEETDQGKNQNVLPQKGFLWLQVADESKQILIQFNQLESKIQARIEKRIELEKVIEYLKQMWNYESSQILDNLNLNNQKYLLNAVQSLNNMRNLTIESEKAINLKNGFSFLVEKVNQLLNYPSPVIRIFSWYILLTGLFFVPIGALSLVTNLKINSALLIAGLSSGFVASVTIVSTSKVK